MFVVLVSVKVTSGCTYPLMLARILVSQMITSKGLCWLLAGLSKSSRLTARVTISHVSDTGAFCML